MHTGDAVVKRLPPESTPAVTLEIVAEVPLPEFLAMPRQPHSAAATRPRAGMRVLAVRDQGSGEDTWASPQAADTAILGEWCDGEVADVALYRATVPVVEGAATTLYRCQILQDHTAVDTSGRHWNETPHPTEEALIAIEIARASTADADTSVGREPLRIPGRAGVGRVRPGIHTIRLVLTENGEVKVSGSDE
jgi:hypothetical protein